MQSVCVFCGSSYGKRDVYRETAQALGHELARQQLTLVWGGGHVGLMGTIADAVLDAGGETVGVIPSFMVEKELAHPDSTELIEVDSMHTRKALMAERADGFIAMPGGFGTADELFEILTWAQLHIHKKPVGLLNVAGFFDPLLAWIRHAEAEGFIRPGHLDLLIVADTPDTLLDAMRQHREPEGDWADKVNRAKP
ncbi:TIGR00730 family Rossman fold protein [Chitinimonas sp. BJYL2]|uniref:LOG family protein n=1 Tax=Chitinimonas sp. BJYL2 TaxID=2976696 RepID=UPI0022B5863E|nr:TIGR00730 family Rossman fold protein [Chitinimonas sp. BJYL2]